MTSSIDRRLRALESRLPAPSPSLPPLNWSAFTDDELQEFRDLVECLDHGQVLEGVDLERFQHLGAKVTACPAERALVDNPDREGSSDEQ